MKNIKFILSVLILLFSLIDLGVTFGFNRYIETKGGLYSLDNTAIYHANPYNNLVPLLGAIFVFSIIALLSLFVKKRVPSKVVRFLALAIVGFFYVVLYLDKMKFVNNPDVYFTVLRETMYIERLGFCLSLIWLLIEIFSVINWRVNKERENG